MAEKIKDFKELRIWQKGIEIVKTVYILSKQFPKEELYGLSSQMKRSAVSIPSNIAEGFRRYHNNEYRQYLYITMGSAAELETQLIISKELGFLNEDQLGEILKEIESLSKMVRVLISKL